MKVQHVALLTTALLTLIAVAPRAGAEVVDLRNLVAANPSLIHHYTFEGATSTEREEAKQGSARDDEPREGDNR